MKIPILFEDNHLLIIEKPVNMPVQEDSSGDLDVLTALKNDLKIRYQKPGNVYLGLVHRLDRPVGGVMVFAKTSKAASRLSDTLRKKQITRQYTAILRGKLHQQTGTLTHYLLKDRKKNEVKVVSSKHPEGKKAILHFEKQYVQEQLTKVHVYLETGRSHQIRVQFSEFGFPLYGDQKYGSHLNRKGQQIALWATELSFPHPITKEIVSFTSLPPAQYPWQL